MDLGVEAGWTFTRKPAREELLNCEALWLAKACCGALVVFGCGWMGEVLTRANFGSVGGVTFVSDWAS